MAEKDDSRAASTENFTEPEQTPDYWTSERLRNASPVPLPKGPAVDDSGNDPACPEDEIDDSAEAPE